jgi:hypothetical protein
MRSITWIEFLEAVVATGEQPEWTEQTHSTPALQPDSGQSGQRICHAMIVADRV